MLHLLKAIGLRIRMLFLLDAVSDLETEFVSREAERRAELQRQAARYEEQGQSEVAGFLRQEAQQLSSQQPLGRVLPALQNLTAGQDAESTTDAPPPPANIPVSGLPASRRKR